MVGTRKPELQSPRTVHIAGDSERRETAGCAVNGQVFPSPRQASGWACSCEILYGLSVCRHNRQARITDGWMSPAHMATAIVSRESSNYNVYLLWTR